MKVDRVRVTHTDHNKVCTCRQSSMNHNNNDDRSPHNIMLVEMEKSHTNKTLHISLMIFQRPAGDLFTTCCVRLNKYFIISNVYLRE